MRRMFVHRLLTSIFFILMLVTSCRFSDDRPDIRGSDISIQISRFEQEMFEMNTDTLAEAIDFFYSRYDDFFEIFNHYIADLGNPSDRAYAGYLTMFIHDDLNREVYASVQEVFADVSSLEESFTNAFRYYQYYFPQGHIPEVVSYISRFSYPYFTVSDYLGIGLDMYLGADSEYYERLGIPLYQRQKMYPERIPADALSNWANELFPYNDSVNNVLTQLIREGQLMYFLSKLLPDQSDALRFGFTDDQMRWVRNNEVQMWAYLVENKLLYSSDEMTIRRLVQPAPYTYYFTQESPGRAAVWLGYTIVQEYARRNPDQGLSDIMGETRYQEILRLSKYNP